MVYGLKHTPCFELALTLPSGTGLQHLVHQCTLYKGRSLVPVGRDLSLLHCQYLIVGKINGFCMLSVYWVIPANISTKSEPAIEMNGTPASVAMALAKSVLPVPGGPNRRAPWEGDRGRKGMDKEV